MLQKEKSDIKLMSQVIIESIQSTDNVVSCLWPGWFCDIDANNRRNYWKTALLCLLTHILWKWWWFNIIYYLLIYLLKSLLSPHDLEKMMGFSLAPKRETAWCLFCHRLTSFKCGVESILKSYCLFLRPSMGRPRVTFQIFWTFRSHLGLWALLT